MGYAIISLGGKQYRVREGQTLLVDRVPAEEGATFAARVLFLGGDGDAQLAPDVTATARVVGHELGEKIRIGKYRPKKGYRKHTGYRSRLTRIAIESIAGERPSEPPAVAEPAEERPADAEAVAAPEVEAPEAEAPGVEVVAAPEADVADAAVAGASEVEATEPEAAEEPPAEPAAAREAVEAGLVEAEAPEAAAAEEHQAEVETETEDEAAADEPAAERKEGDS